MTAPKGAILVLLAGVLWSTQGVILRQITEAQSWAVMFWRSLGLIAALGLYITWQTRGRLWAAIAQTGRGGWAGAGALVLAFGGAIYALQSTTVASAVVIFAAAPFFAALIGWAALRERVGPATWAAIAAASLGIAIMVGGQVDLRHIWGNIAALICAFGFGAFSVALRTGGGTGGGTLHFPIVLLGGLLAAPVGAALALATGQSLMPPLPDIGLALFMGAATLAGGMIIYTHATRAVPAATATLLAQIEVILGPFWVWLFMAEAPSRSVAFGGAIVLAALVGDVLAQRPRPT